LTSFIGANRLSRHSAGEKLTKHSKTPTVGPDPGGTPEALRRRREAEALRQNLLKRKSQQRGRRHPTHPGAADDGREKPRD
jgi:hypothetical protein